MKLENKRNQIIEYGNIGAKPVTSAAASLKNAGDYKQKPKTSALDAKLSKAFHDMQGQKLSIKAGIVLLVNPMFKTVSIIPGIDILAPDLTDNNSGFFMSPKPFDIVVSTVFKD